MKKLVVGLMLFALLFSMAGCAATAPETLATVTQAPTAGEILTPPDGYVVLGLADGSVPLKTGGYTWSRVTGHGTAETFHADQWIQPLPLESMESVAFQAVPIDGTAVSEEGFVARLGCQVFLDWQIPPDAVSGVCWPTDYKTDTQPELSVNCKTDQFTAYVGSFIYELNAAWLDDGDGYSGKASYYIHVTVGEIGVVPIQTAQEG